MLQILIRPIIPIHFKSAKNGGEEGIKAKLFERQAYYSHPFYLHLAQYSAKLIQAIKVTIPKLTSRGILGQWKDAILRVHKHHYRLFPEALSHIWNNYNGWLAFSDFLFPFSPTSLLTSVALLVLF